MSSSNLIHINVGGKQFITTRSTLFPKGSDNFFSNFLKDEDDVLSGFSYEKDKDGYFFVDREGKYFEIILEFLRTFRFVVPRWMNQSSALQLVEEFEFYCIEYDKILFYKSFSVFFINDFTIEEFLDETYKEKINYYSEVEERFYNNLALITKTDFIHLLNIANSNVKIESISIRNSSSSVSYSLKKNSSKQSKSQQKEENNPKGFKLLLINSNLKLLKSQFSSLTIPRTNFNNSNIKNITMKDCDLSNSSFLNCFLYNTSFVNCNLTSCLFTNSHINKNTCFKGSSLNLMDLKLFHEALLIKEEDMNENNGDNNQNNNNNNDDNENNGEGNDNENINKHSIDSFDGCTFVNCKNIGYFQFKGKSFIQAKFGQLNLSAIDFSDSDLRGAIFENCNLQTTCFSNSNIKQAKFIDCNINFASFVGTLTKFAEFTNCKGNIFE